MSKHIVQFTTVHPQDDSRVFKICRSLAKSGLRVTFLVPSDSDSEIEGVRIKALPRARRRLDRLPLMYHAFRECLALNGDLYHFHDPELLGVGALIRTRTGKPVVYDVHEYFAKGLLSKPYLGPQMGQVAAALFPPIERFFVRRISAVVAVNDDLAGSYAPSAKRFISVYNYPEATDFPPELTGAGFCGPRPKRLLYLGSINQDRGLETLLDMILIVHRFHPDAILRIVGRIDQQGLSDSCRFKLEHLRDTKLFEHIPAVNFSEVPSYLADAYLGLIPLSATPENQEGLPRKLFEYMLVGLPVVASDVGRVSGVLNRAGCGLLARPGDSGSFAEQAVRLLNEPEAAELMGERGRQACVSDYMWEPQFHKLIELYEDLLS